MKDFKFSRSSKQKKRQLHPVFEQLESRQLLAADGVNAIAEAILPTATVADVYVPTADAEVEFVGPKAQFPAQTNPVNALDVNADGHVAPIDALLIINALNSNSQTTGVEPIAGEGESPERVRFLDVDGDGFATKSDAQIVIEMLNYDANAALPPLETGLPAIALIPLLQEPLSIDDPVLPVEGVFRNPLPFGPSALPAATPTSISGQTAASEAVPPYAAQALTAVPTEDSSNSRQPTSSLQLYKQAVDKLLADDSLLSDELLDSPLLAPL